MAERSLPPRFDIAALLHVHRALLLALLASLTLLVVIATLPSRPQIFHVLQKLAHPTVFGVVALALLVLLRQRRESAATPPWSEYLLALALATALGALTELGQILTHRDPTLHDVGLDLRGAACALAFAAGFDGRCQPSGRERLRLVYLTAGGLLAVWIATPLAWAGAAYANRALLFPVLFVPRSPLDTYFVATVDRGAVRSRLEPRWSREAGEFTLHVQLWTRPYSGVSLEEPSADWSGYRSLLIDVVNPSRTPLELNVRVNDRAHDGRYADRFNGRYPIPGRTREMLEIPLEAVRGAPAGRSMDLEQIANVNLFRAGEAGPHELLLNRIELR